MTMRALEAAKALEADSIDVAVLHVPTIKPLDTETILREAGPDRPAWWSSPRTTRSIGGLGEAVAGTLMRAGVAPPLPPDRPAGRVPGRRRAADAARSLQDLDIGDRGVGQSLELIWHPSWDTNF